MTLTALSLLNTSRPSLLPALLSGLLCILAMPGLVGWWWLAAIALVPLITLCAHATPARAALGGLLAGLLHHLALLYWIVIVLGRYGGLNAGLAGAALFALALYMSIYPAVWAAALSWSWRRPGRFARQTALWGAPLFWTGLEWVRSWLGTGFPWMDLGYVLADQPLLLQVADLGGHLSLGFLLVVLNMLLSACWLGMRRGAFRPGRLGAGVAVLLLAAWVVYGAVRLPQVERLAASAPRQRVAVVQGNIAQDLKWSAAMQEETLRRYETLTLPLLTRDALVIWPETALPFWPDRTPLFVRVQDLAAREGSWLLTGAPTVNETAAGTQHYNSALLLDSAGDMAAMAHKRHLVPFGEYIPLRRILFFLAPVVETLGDFSSGHVQPPLPAGASRIGVLICYESIFPHIARRWVLDGANLLANLTNDAWYGRSSAPWHSQAMAVLRAVETRRSLARAANTGISSIISPSGRIVAFTPLFEPAVLADALSLMEVKTVFVRWGHRFGPACLLLALVGLFLLLRRR